MSTKSYNIAFEEINEIESEEEAENE